MRKLLKHPVISNLSAIIIGISVAIAFGEIIVRLVIPEEKFWPLKSNVYQARESEEGYTFRSTLDTVAFNGNFRTNSMGFLGPEWARVAPPQTCRIAIIGDSHAAGFGVEYSETFGEQLVQALNQSHPTMQYQALNFGVHGYNSLQQLAVTRRYVHQYAPDLVILNVTSNDHVAQFYVDDDGWLYSEIPTESKPTSFWGQLFHAGKINRLTWRDRNSRLWVFLRMELIRYRQSGQATQDVRQSTVGNSESWLPSAPAAEPKAYLRESVYDPVMAIVDEFQDSGTPLILNSFNSRRDYQQMLETIALKRNLPRLEFLGQLPGVHSWEEVQKEYGLGWDDHLNAEAHSHWSAALFTMIENCQISPRQ